VKCGERIARASSDGVSVCVHASIDGEVTAVGERGVEIHAR
jgi:hypothetical protein